MKLTIDNLDGRGPWDYTAFVEQKPRLVRALNRPTLLRFRLVATTTDFVVPASGARVMLGRLNGEDQFTGYIIGRPKYELLGWGTQGPTFRYELVAQSDEVMLDHKTVRRRFPFVARSAGDALRQLVEDLIPGAFDTSAVADLDILPLYPCDPQKTWSEHAAEIALRARGSYRTLGGKLIFEAVGTRVHRLDESDREFSPEGLRLTAADGLINDVTVVGLVEPQAHVKDYFVGDGYSLKFYLSQIPFMSTNRTMLEEEYASLDPTRWVLSDPAGVISASGGRLVVTGGTGVAGESRLTFSDEIELGGTMFLQHGDVAFDAASDGVLGGLYTGAVAPASCFAGFDVAKVGGQSRIQARLSGNLSGPTVTTQAGHHYMLTTRLYSSEVYRLQQKYHSGAQAAGHGGEPVKADVRVVLEVHDIDRSNPASLVAASTVLYDDVVSDAPGFCIYAPVSARDLHCSITFTRIMRAVNAEVRSALPGQSYRVRLAGSLSDGAHCRVSKEPALQFFPQTMPAPNELISVHYRGSGRALARVTDPVSIATNAHNGDDGVRAAVRNVKSPSSRTALDCEQGAVAILEDAQGPAWSGEYKTWSDFLPGGATDVFPGDVLDVNAPSRGAAFRAIVREVEIEWADLAGDHSEYTVRFADDAAQPLTIEFDAGRVTDALDLAPTPLGEVGTNFLPDLIGAELILPPSSTTVTIDAGLQPVAGNGIEVRWTDTGWGMDNDRNLVGRFGSRTFTAPRLGRVQDYYLRQYDNSSPARYSRYSAALHLDYPL